MLAFGEPPPPALQWWAPWVHAVVFGGLAGVLTYGTVTWGAPPDRAGTSVEMWFVIGVLWVVAGIGLVRALIVTIRRSRRRG
jgi:hypothetical protein